MGDCREGGDRYREGHHLVRVQKKTMKANSASLIGRVASGEGHRLAARRRTWFRREEERREDSRRAHCAVNVVGRGVFRGRGNFVTG